MIKVYLSVRFLSLGVDVSCRGLWIREANATGLKAVIEKDKKTKTIGCFFKKKETENKNRERNSNNKEREREELEGSTRTAQETGIQINIFDAVI